jgi:hypothetical protein
MNLVSRDSAIGSLSQVHYTSDNSRWTADICAAGLYDRGARNVTKISNHSYRMTLFGATVVARCAGTKFATNATNNRTAAVAEKARTSAVPTP